MGSLPAAHSAPETSVAETFRLWLLNVSRAERREDYLAREYRRRTIERHGWRLLMGGSKALPSPSRRCVAVASGRGTAACSRSAVSVGASAYWLTFARGARRSSARHRPLPTGAYGPSERPAQGSQRGSRCALGHGPQRARACARCQRRAASERGAGLTRGSCSCRHGVETKTPAQGRGSRGVFAIRESRSSYCTVSGVSSTPEHSARSRSRHPAGCFRSAMRTLSQSSLLWSASSSAVARCNTVAAG